MTQLGMFSAGADRAFPSLPRVDRYFPAAAAEEARMRLMSCIDRGEGPAVLIGGSGTGKTMLLEVLAESFAERFAVVSLASTQLCTRRALLQAILFGLKQPFREREEGELRLTLVDRLQDSSLFPNGMLLLVDEAQALPVRLLEELRVLGNLSRDGQSLVRMVLAGSSQLEEQFAAPELETFNQRLASRCYLAPLTHNETLQYVRAHVAAVGGDPETLLVGGALDAVYQATDGVPRLINQICDRAIVMAVESGETVIDSAAIQRAWSDIHQLPAPWHAPEPISVSPPSVSFAEESSPELLEDSSLSDAPLSDAPLESIVEFGALDELPTTPKTTSDDGVWNADKALESLPTIEPTLEPEAKRGCGSKCGSNCGSNWHASGSSSSDTEYELEPEMQLAPLEETRVELAEQVSLPPQSPVAKPEKAEKTVDPFGDDFAEEEVVIDRFASIEEAFGSSTPVVINASDRAFSEELSTVMPGEATSDLEFDSFDSEEDTDEIGDFNPAICAAEIDANDEVDLEDDDEAAELESEVLRIRDTLAAAVEMTPMVEVDAYATLEPTDASRYYSADIEDTEIDEPEYGSFDNGLLTGDDELVIEEDEEPAAISMVRRQEYRQLFASLRGT